MSRRVEVYVPLERILMDRVPLDETVVRYALAMNRGDEFPAIRCALREDGKLEIRDGRHRWAASILAGRRGVLARFSLVPLKAVVR